MAQKIKPIDPDSKEAAKVKEAFDSNVNMTRKKLEKWLEGDRAKSVGQKSGGGESVGHASGRRIVTILETRKKDLTAKDYAHMKKVNGYIERHLKQRPDKTGKKLAESDWTASLRNWGHDPVK